MKKNDKYSNMSVIEAQYEAQKIAFAPFVFQVSKALRDLKVLEILNPALDKGLTFQELMDKLSLSEYSLSVMLEAGVSIGLILFEDDHYSLSKVGYFINSDEMTKVNMNFTQDVCYEGLKNLESSIVSERPSGLDFFGKWNTIYEGLTTLPKETQKSWYEFDHYYSDLAFDEILPIVFKNNPLKIFDFGGNTGRFAKKCLNYANNSSVTIFDHISQLEKAKKNFADDYSDRINFMGIDFLDLKLKTDERADVVWMSQFLDCFSKDQVKDILGLAKDILNPGGEIFIME
ncbi:MAG: methyltransferase domain-containing protein, partial [Deltaproteobacteria bacterium]|nr:methyltransferase domain-containing protein [Deltaproteobacteria bacterium]